MLKRYRIVALLPAIVLAAVLCWRVPAQSPANVQIIARGAGVTMLEGGTGSPDFLPVMTQIAFHVENVGGVISGNFECLAFGPHSPAGPLSGAFDSNVMYVTGPVQGVALVGDTIRISGGSNCTGIGAGTNVPFSAIIQKGGPGATVILTGGANQQVFRETLVSGFFEMVGQPSTAALLQGNGIAGLDANPRASRGLGFLTPRSGK
jgi:hypothetical protein